MLRIYDEIQLNRRTRLKSLQVAALFVGGALCGGLWSASGVSLSEIGTAAAHKAAAETSTAAPGWCDTARLRMDCTLSLPPLPRAEGV